MKARPYRPARTRRTFLLATAATLAAGFVANRVLGSRSPAAPNDANPLPLCPGPPNCYRVSAAFGADVQAVYEAAEHAVRQSSGLTTGHVVEVRPDGRYARGLAERGLAAVVRVGPFQDDLALVVTPQSGASQRETGGPQTGGAVLHVRSASRAGRGDLGVNRRRVRALLAEVERALG